MPRFQINFTTGTDIHPPKEFDGSYEEAKKFAEGQLGSYPSGTRYHLRIWRTDPSYPAWAPCDDKDFQSC